ncbi:MAG: ATP-dependent sacrificial sulfur transferase LarE [Candidatus Melainabacteria bacterium]|nr:MAG: ATP-dependent sacrificial sulfur transferase LarE [Candidatus Melainabacteria bacterium]
MVDVRLVEKKEKDLRETLTRLESLLIAYSGGVDSSLLSYYGRLLLGKQATIVIAISASLANDELAFARAQSEQFNWDLLEIATDEIGKSEYQRNDSMRCYYCKSTLFQTMHKLASEKGVKHLAYGANLDDLSDFRPGMLAANQYHVLSPLQEASFTKEEIRYLAKRAGLPSWERPQAACLSSRIPTDTPITITTLSRVDRAETFLRNRGFRQVRVRHYDELASIEVETSEVHRLKDETLLAAITEEFKQIGYLQIKVDPAGYRQGSLNLSRS